MRCLTAARGPACSSRSNAAPVPAPHEIAPADYQKLVQEARAFLSGKSQSVKDDLALQMEQASADLAFEAGRCLSRPSFGIVGDTGDAGHQSTFGGGGGCLCHSTGGAGRPVSRCFSSAPGRTGATGPIIPRADKSLEPGEVLSAFIAQFYDDKPVPSLVLVSHELDDQPLLASALSEKAGSCHHGDSAETRREKRPDPTIALQNAREALGRKMAETASQQRLLQSLTEILHLPQTPKRIELYDNSHISGTNAVGAMVVAGPEGFRKKDYRTFNIQGERHHAGR